MKKLYLLLTSSLVVLAGVGTLATTVAGCRKRKTENAVIVALKKINEKSPLVIGFLGADATASASKDTVTTVIRAALSTLDKKVFTAEVVKEITFGDTLLKPGSTVQVNATYQEHKVPISVKESENLQPVYDALASFDQNKPIEIPYNQKNPTAPANNPAVTKVIRDQLKSKNPTIFTSTVVAEITFSNTPLKENTAVQVQATYKEKATPIYVKEAKNPDQGVYDALAYFTKKNPLLVIYQEKYKTSLASSTELTGQLRLTLGYKRPDIFTETLVSQITFGDEPLKPGTVVEVSATYRGKKTIIRVKEDEKSRVSEVIKALEFFHNKDNVIELSPDKYNRKYTDESSWGDFSEKAGDAIREYIFGNTIGPKSVIKSYFRHFLITFDHKELIKNAEPIEVNAHYLGKSTPIWVKLGYAPRVKKVLEQFTIKNRLKLTQTTTEPHKIFSDDSTGISKIRDALVAQSQGLLTQDLANQITFAHALIAESKQKRAGGPWIPLTLKGFFSATFHKKVEVVVNFVTNEPSLPGH